MENNHILFCHLDDQALLIPTLALGHKLVVIF